MDALHQDPSHSQRRKYCQQSKVKIFLHLQISPLKKKKKKKSTFVSLKINNNSPKNFHTTEIYMVLNVEQDWHNTESAGLFTHLTWDTSLQWHPKLREFCKFCQEDHKQQNTKLTNMSAVWSFISPNLKVLQSEILSKRRWIKCLSLFFIYLNLCTPTLLFWSEKKCIIICN